MTSQVTAHAQIAYIPDGERTRVLICIMSQVTAHAQIAYIPDGEAANLLEVLDDCGEMSEPFVCSRLLHYDNGIGDGRRRANGHS